MLGLVIIIIIIIIVIIILILLSKIGADVIQCFPITKKKLNRELKLKQFD